jgi:putative sterol carrier protein
VYEVTPLGQTLEKSLVELGRWGSRFVPPSMDGVTVPRLGSYALTFKTFFRPEAAQAISETYELHIDDEVFQVHIENGSIDVEQGEPRTADVVFHSEVPTILGLMQGLIEPDDALSMGSIRVDGDPSALEQFLRVCGMAELTDATSPVPV